MAIEKGQLEGEFNGFNDTDTIFQFYGGGKWRQAAYKYYYHYAYMPRAQVIKDGAHFILHVEGVNKAVQVVRV